jgi:hypothetical protein
VRILRIKLVQRSESCFRVCLPDEVMHSALKTSEREREPDAQDSRNNLE